MTDLHPHLHGFGQIVDCYQIYPPRAQGSRIQIFLIADHDLALVTLDLNHVQRRTSRDSPSLALANGEVVDAVMLADYLSVGGHEFASGIGQRLALLGQIGIEKLLVVASGDEADLLRIWLCCESQPVITRQITDLRLGHFSERKKRAAELILGQTEQKISLILRGICRTLEQPAAALLIELNSRVVTSGERVRADLLSDNQQLVELQMVVAQAARDGRAPGQIFLDEGLHDVALEPVFVIDYVIWDAQSFSNAAGVVDIVERTATALPRLGHAFVSGEPTLVPELHGQADDLVSVGAQHGRDGRGVDSARHGYGDGFVLR